MKMKGLWKSIRIFFDEKCQLLTKQIQQRHQRTQGKKKKNAAVFFDVEKASDTPIVEYRPDDIAKGFLPEIKVQIKPNNYFLTSL